MPQWAHLAKVLGWVNGGGYQEQQLAYGLCMEPFYSGSAATQVFSYPPLLASGLYRDSLACIGSTDAFSISYCSGRVLLGSSVS